jgi:hypothetical protein
LQALADRKANVDWVEEAVQDVVHTDDLDILRSRYNIFYGLVARHGIEKGTVTVRTKIELVAILEKDLTRVC